MRNTSRWLRRCAIVISVAHSAIFVSFFFPNYWGWQVACQCSFTLSPADLHLVIGSLLIIFAVVLAMLVLPPLSVWLLVRFPARLPGLFGLWLSLPLTSLYALYYGLLTVYEGATGFRSPFLFVYWIPPLALLLSFL